MTQGFYSPLLLSLRFSYTILPFFPLLSPSSSPKFISYSPPSPTVIISNLFRFVSIEKDIREYANLRAKSSDAPRLKFCVASNNHLFHLLLSPSMSFLFSFINSDRSNVRTTACPIFLLFFFSGSPFFWIFSFPRSPFVLYIGLITLRFDALPPDGINADNLEQKENWKETLILQ